MHTQFLKRLIGVNRNTTNILVRGDLGRKPLQVNALSRNISYLKYLSNKQNNSLAVQAYIYEKGKLGQRITIENSINKLSLQLTTMEIPFVNIINAPTSTIKKFIHKIYEEKWRSKLTESSKADTYKIFKDCPKFEKYFDYISNTHHLNALVKLRLSDHHLTIEKGRRCRPPIHRE